MSDRYDRMYFRQRHRNRLYDVVARAVEESGLRKSELARKLAVDPSQVTRWLAGPSNWEIDTVSDLLWAASGELDYEFCNFSDRKRGNRFHSVGEPVHDVASRPLGTTTTSGATTVIEVLGNVLLASTGTTRSVVTITGG